MCAEHNQYGREEILSPAEQIDKNDHMISPSTSAKIRTEITMENLKFDVKLEDLKELMQLKGAEAIEKLTEKYTSVETLATSLGSNSVIGISGDKEDMISRRQKYGANEIPPKPSKSFIRLALEACRDPTLIMLMICAVVSIGLSFYHPSESNDTKPERMSGFSESQNLEWIEGVAIILAVFIVVFMTAFNDWRKERQFRGLKNRIESDNLTSVVRNGVVTQIHIKDLVVGDVCCIKYGDLIPADGVVTESNDLKIDESSLTGETDLVKKSTNSNIVILSGTHVMEGSGHYLVLAVGVHSQTGIIMTLLGAADDNENEKYQKEKDRAKLSKRKRNKNEKKNAAKISTEPDSRTKSESKSKKKIKKRKYPKKHLSVLQVKLGKLAMKIGYCGITGALLTFVILVLRMCIEEFGIKKNSWNNAYIKYIISFLIQAITVIVVAVPEGLPLAVTLAMAFAVRRMTKDNNLVRHLDACETMGSATTICSDKTGTLTTNRMTAMQCWIGDQMFSTIPDKNQVNEISRELIYESISVNSNYTSRIEPVSQLGELPKQVGNKTECGLLGFVTDLGGDYKKSRLDFQSEQHVKVFTFNSARKMMSTVIRPHKNTGEHYGYRLHSKGASEIVLNKCAFYINSEGKTAKLEREKIDEIIRTVIDTMASGCLRTICVAYRDFIPESDKPDLPLANVEYYSGESPNWDDDEENLIKDLTCLCLVGIEDPVRAEVPEAIKKCQSGGVVVRMVTGDNVNTATSIALKCGIITPGDDFLVLESKEFNKRIKDENGVVQQKLFDKVWPRLRVLARSSPQDKYVLVNGIVESRLSPNREVVAVTGDGTNDGPALKRADVGFAMGIQGTDVAKEASDIILTDDNFSSIVKAILWGRNVYDSIAKFLQFQLAANLTAGVFSIVCAASIQAVPLKAVQMLWVNLVMDTLASLALATEPPTEDLLNRKPYGRSKPIVSLTMLKNIVGHAIYQLVIMFILVFKIEDWMMVDSVIKYDDLTKLAQPSVHFTIIFNVFILMTLFNEFNARRIHDERNVFSGVLKNIYFIVIWGFCFVAQILIVNFGGRVFAVEPIDLEHWMWSIFFGVGSLLWGQVLITIPKCFIKKIVHVVLFWRYRKSKKSDNEKIKDNDEFFNEQNKDIGSLDGDKDYLDSKNIWIRGATRIQNQMHVVDTFQKKIDEAEESEVDDVQTKSDAVVS